MKIVIDMPEERIRQILSGYGHGCADDILHAFREGEILTISHDEQKEWHLCSDKQPQDPCKDYGIEDGDRYFSVSKNYLITINGKVTIGRWVRQINRGLRWQDYGEKQYEIFPTAWMPLPEPYKVESEDEG